MKTTEITLRNGTKITLQVTSKVDVLPKVKKFKSPPPKAKRFDAYTTMINNRDMEGLYKAALSSVVNKCTCHTCYSCKCRIAYFHLKRKYNLINLKEV